MKKYSILIAFVLFYINCIFSQVGVNLRNYHFGEIPSISAEEVDLLTKNEIAFLRYNHVLDYFPNNDQFELWELKHQAIQVNKEIGIEKFSTLNFGSIDPKSIQNIQIRIINEGVITKDYSKKDIEKLIYLDSSESVYPLCKVDLANIKVGSIIEFFYTRIRPNLIEQDFFYLQSDAPVKNVYFTIVMPEYLKPHVQVYNGDYPVIDTVDEVKGLRYTTVYIPFLAALPYEPFSFQKKHCCRVEFNYAYNLSQGRFRLNTTKDFMESFYETIQINDKEVLKFLQNEVIKKINIKKNNTLEDKIITIENFFKENLFGVNTIFSIKMYTYVLNYFDIKYEMVLTCNKTLKEFDTNYNGSNFYEEIMFYFPEIDKYLAPMEYTFRLGLIPMKFNGNSAIFLKEVQNGDVKSLTHNYKIISTTPKSVNIDHLKLDLSVNPNNGMISGKIEKVQGGYLVNNIQSFFKSFEIEDLEQFIEEQFSFGSESMNISNESFLNTDCKDIGVNPLISSADISNYDWAKINKNGTIDLFVGKMIGKQEKIEKKGERILPIERGYTTSYQREINILIPKGYKVESLEGLNKTIYDSDNPSNATAGFTATFHEDGKIITIKSTEFYDKLLYKVEDFNLIERVINESANFNDIKIRLVKI